MRIGIMQPYFFPYIGYFSLIKYTDLFVFFDTPQYITHGWINRNRILNCDGVPTYITVPIKKAPRETPINEIHINTNMSWKEKIYGQLSAYKKKAPNYNMTMDFLHDLLDKIETEKLSDLNIYTLKKICDYLDVSREFFVFSEMDLNIGEISSPDDWALNITKAMGIDTYVNPPGGQTFFDREKYKREGIKLEFLKSNLKRYVQRIGHFEPGLSIIDVMMFCKKDEILDILDDYTIL